MKKLLATAVTASREFETVNNVAAHGGSIASTGAVIVDGMVFVGSGYAISSGALGGNVLLAWRSIR